MYIDHLPTCGFQMSIQLPETAGLPPANSHIYVEWNEEDSEEPKGWYHCEVEEYKPDVSATICYRDGSHESLDLRSVNWSFARKSAKPFLRAGLEPPQHPLKKTREAAQTLKQAKSNPYSVLSPITMLSSSPDAHQAALSDVDRKCTDLGLQVRPDKCVSYIFDGKKTHNHTTFNLQQGTTHNITSAPTKFLGQTIGANAQTTKSLSAKKIIEKMYRALDEIDKRPIRGEYKVWIYKSYLVPSLTFNLTVERIPKSAISKLQTRATCLIKRWLNVPRCATLVSLFHPEVTNLPYLSHTHEKAKLRLLVSQVYVSQDTRI